MKMIKPTNKQVEAVKEWLIGSKGSIFGIVYRDMLKDKLEPFGKDINMFFKRAEKLRDKVTKNPKVKKLYDDVNNLNEGE
jgi:hypothetical protein